MPCTWCGEWARFFGWFSIWQLSPEDLKRLWQYQRDPQDDGLVWYRRCLPTCKVNEIYRRLEALEGAWPWMDVAALARRWSESGLGSLEEYLSWGEFIGEHLSDHLPFIAVLRWGGMSLRVMSWNLL